MTTKEYLSQAYRIDKRINSKIEQLKHWQDLATKATSTLSDTSGCSCENNHKMEDVIIKIIDLKNEINADIDKLVDLKKDIMALIKTVENPEYQTLLELRYLCYKKWEQIAVFMECGIDNVYKMHLRALKSINFSKALQ
ncbi:MAG: DUF1492 domain-containing protein [Treponema sp.]|nr:DUF1492 domain-containing protein [Treponema sp.]